MAPVRGSPPSGLAGPAGLVASLQAAELGPFRETRGKGDEVMDRRKGWAGEQAGRRGACLCQFCFPAPHFPRSADNLVWVQENDRGAEDMKPRPGLRAQDAGAGASWGGF